MTITSQFFCKTCKTIFDSEKIKQESVHPIYGACWKYIAACPQCNETCDEYKVRVSLKSSDAGDCCMERQGGGHQHSGCCGCS